MACFATAVVACAPQAAVSRVASGQTFATGNPKYDTYFRDVEVLNRNGEGWVARRLVIRKALFERFNLPHDAHDTVLLEAVFTASDKAHIEGALAKQLEGLLVQEKERATALHATHTEAYRFAEQGKRLFEQSKRDFNDAAFTENRKSVAQEIEGSMVLLRKLDVEATREAAAAEAVIALFQRALREGAPHGSAPSPVPVETKPNGTESTPSDPLSKKYRHELPPPAVTAPVLRTNPF
jgi:hypothetical protein